MTVALPTPFFMAVYRPVFSHDVFLLLASFNCPLAALLIMQLQFYRYAFVSFQFCKILGLFFILKWKMKNEKWKKLSFLTVFHFQEAFDSGMIRDPVDRGYHLICGVVTVCVPQYYLFFHFEQFHLFSSPTISVTCGHLLYLLREVMRKGSKLKKGNERAVEVFLPWESKIKRKLLPVMSAMKRVLNRFVSWAAGATRLINSN